VAWLLNTNFVWKSVCQLVYTDIYNSNINVERGPIKKLILTIVPYAAFTYLTIAPTLWIWKSEYKEELDYTSYDVIVWSLYHILSFLTLSAMATVNAGNNSHMLLYILKTEFHVPYSPQ
jgi:hypothetical protein